MAITEDKIRALLDERAEEGVFRVHRSMFIDPELFELEMHHIFESNWIYLAHESQIPNPHDFLTGQMGRQPIILSRGADGEIFGVLNSCAHRGSQLVMTQCGRRKHFVCPFHGWSFRPDGRLLSCGNTDEAGYGPGFDESKLNLGSIARVESYRGFIFGSLSADVVPLSDYLGEARTFIDLIVDQDPNGEIEIVPGPQAYTYNGNWKLQSENGVDGYHIGVVHGNYVQTYKNRQMLEGEKSRIKPMDVSGFRNLPGGYYAFENGHVVLWNESPNPQVRPSWKMRDAYAERFGAERGWWMNNCWRNLFIYPNLFLMDQMSTQIRVIHPASVDRTEVRTLCFAPKCDDAEQRMLRIRQYEDFFNASGLATPDDLAAFNASQKGFLARSLEWSDISRGAKNTVSGGDERAKQLRFNPKFCGTQLEDEGIYLNQHHQWRRLLVEGIRNENRS